MKLSCWESLNIENIKRKAQKSTGKTYKVPDGKLSSVA